MASMGKLALLAVLVAAVATITDGSAIRLDDSNSVNLKPGSDDFEMFYRQFLEYFKPPTVAHFATHNLCKRLRRQFELAMAKKLWNMNEEFVKRFVHKLCEKKPNTMLKLWVSELFDSDGNGFIDDHEKNAIIDMNDVE